MHLPQRPRIHAATLLLLALFAASSSSVLRAAPAPATDTPPPSIPVTFTLKEPGLVTLVIEGPDGKRVRNLVSETAFPAGSNTIAWDGLDDLGRDPEAAKNSLFHIPGKLVAPGTYTVRGLVHPPIDITYQLTPYSEGKPPWNNGDPAGQWLTNHSAPSDVIFVPAGKAPARDGKPSSAGGQLLVCSRVAEGGSGLAWLDTDGQKLWGQHWLGGVWTAASHLALDEGDHPVEGVYAYAAASWKGDKYNDNKSELRLHKLVDASHRVKAPKDKRFGSGEDRPVLEPTYTIPLLSPLPDDFKKRDERAQRALLAERAADLTGLAVRNGIVWSAFEKLNHVVVIDAHAAKTLGTVTIPAARGLAFDKAGHLYALSENRVLRYTIDPAKPLALPEPVVVVSKENLQDPQDLIIGPDGTIYVSDWGTSHQVKRFKPDGTALASIGVAGKPAIGAYNVNHMNQPAGMALDDRGRLWVAENSHIPKRVSIWNLSDGSLGEAFYGPMRYGGSGAVDPKDRTRFFYDDDHGGTIEFKLDYATGRSTPVSIPYRDEEDHTGLEGRYVGGAPSYPLYHQGRLYLTNAYSLHTTGRRSATLWRRDDDGIARIVSAAGNIIDSSNAVMPAFRRPEIIARMPEGFTPEEGKSLFFVWSDLNGDQKLDPAEVQFAKASSFTDKKLNRENITSVSIDDSLAWTTATVGDVVLQLNPVSVNAAGAPAYDLAKPVILARGVQSPVSSGGGQVLAARDGWTITTTPVAPLPREALGGVRNGEAVWSYPSLWPGLHISHNAPVAREPDEVIGTTRVVGPVIDAPPGSDAGQLWAINADKGTVYVFTVDGLFVTRLFQDSRTASWNAPEAKRGMSVANLSLNQECFGPTWTRTDAGEIYLQAGGTGNILRVEHLDKVRRLPDQPLTVTREQLAAAQRDNLHAESARQAASNTKLLPLAARLLKTPPVIDGDSADWAGAAAVTIDERTRGVGNWGKTKVSTTASVSISGDRLYVLWRTQDPDLLRNSGESMTNLFKGGGCLDLMIGTDASADPKRREPVAGDQRLLVTQVKGKTVAVLYAPVAPGVTTEPVVFGSPLRSIRFARVDVVSDDVTIAVRKTPNLKKDSSGKLIEADYELSVPLALLGFEPKAGTSYKFDIGLLRGDGAQTLQRVYWSNKASGLVADIPSEAELTPALWGVLTITD